MKNLTENEMSIIERQGWDTDSLLDVLTSWDPYQCTREEHFAQVAAVENGEAEAGDGFVEKSNLKRAVVVTEVLYDSEINRGTLDYETVTGHASGFTPEKMAELLIAQGTDYDSEINQGPDFLYDLEALAYETTTGHASGFTRVVSISSCTPEKMSELLVAQGSDPEFLIDDLDDDEDDLDGDTTLD